MGAPSEEEFVEFYRAHWRRLVGALRWAVPEGEDPRDAAQEAMVRAYERWGAVRTHERPDAWLFLTGYRVAGRMRRRATLRGSRMQPAAVGEVQPSRALELEEAFGSLTARQRAALLLRHHFGFSTRETARAMRCREGTVKSLLARGRDALRAATALEEA